MSCRTGPLRVERSLRDAYTLSGVDERLGSSRCSEAIFVTTNGSTVTDDVATTGTHATKWPPSAQEARPAGHGVYSVAGVRLGGSGGAGDPKDARWGAEPADAGGGWQAVGGEVSE